MLFFPRVCMVSNSRESLKGTQVFRLSESFSDLYETRDLAPALLALSSSPRQPCPLSLPALRSPPPFEGESARQEGQLEELSLLRHVTASYAFCLSQHSRVSASMLLCVAVTPSFHIQPSPLGVCRRHARRPFMRCAAGTRTSHMRAQG